MTHDIPTTCSLASPSLRPVAAPVAHHDLRPAPAFEVNGLLLARLQREWRTLSHRPSVLRRAAAWGLGVELRSLDDLVVAAGFVPYRRGGRAEPAEGHNEVLARLLVLARTDDLAARVVLQRLLTGLVAVARRWLHRPEGGEPAFEEVVGAAWTVIRTFPVERRPHHLASNLLRDAEHVAFKRATRRAMVVEYVPEQWLDRPVPAAVDDPAPAALAELHDLVACARARHLSDDDLELLRLLLAGYSQIEVAERLDISVRSVWNRRETLVHRLRAAAREAAAA